MQKKTQTVVARENVSSLHLKYTNFYFAAFNYAILTLAG